MGKRQYTDNVQEQKVGVDEKTSSGVQGSGRFFFALAKILVDVIDDELQVSDAHKCAGKKADKVKRVGRVATNVVSKFSVKQAKLGCTSGQDDCEFPFNL
jgi:hypothetical protein